VDVEIVAARYHRPRSELPPPRNRGSFQHRSDHSASRLP
jgi:hypothetical protein